MNRWVVRRLLPLVIAAGVPLSAILSGASGAGTGVFGPDRASDAPGGVPAHGADGPAGIPVSGESLLSSLVPVASSLSGPEGASGWASQLDWGSRPPGAIRSGRAAARLPCAFRACSLPQRPRPPPGSLQDR